MTETLKVWLGHLPCLYDVSGPIFLPRHNFKPVVTETLKVWLRNLAELYDVSGPILFFAKAHLSSKCRPYFSSPLLSKKKKVSERSGE